MQKGLGKSWELCLNFCTCKDDSDQDGVVWSIWFLLDYEYEIHFGMELNKFFKNFDLKIEKLLGERGGDFFRWRGGVMKNNIVGGGGVA